MKKYLNSLFALFVLVLSGLTLASCSDEDYNTGQYVKEVHLNVFGPSPVMRGGELRFLGSNLEQVVQVIIPGCEPITNIEKVKEGIPSEIRVTVPQNAEPGIITLITNTDKKIETATPIAYTEPIVIDGFTPANALPGQKVTIKGDYLNLIHAVAFAENVVIGEKDFVEHSREAITVVVPETARTGKLSLYDVDITALEDAESDVTYNIMTTEEAFIVGTATVAGLATERSGKVAALGEVTAKLGETITINGENFNLVASLVFGDADNAFQLKDVTEFTVNKEGTVLTVVLPAEAPDGDINIVCKNGVPVPVGKLVTVAPTELVAAPAPVKAGAPLTVTGKDLDVVVKVQFPNCDAQDVTVEEGKIVVEVPGTAQEGDLELIMANGKRTPVAFTLVKPEATGFNMNPAAAGGAVEIQGTNLDLVKEVTFGGDIKVTDFAVSADGTVLTVTIPLKAESGVVTLGLENGTTVETPALEVSKPVFCYILDATILTENDLKAGDLLLVEVENADKLTEVQIDGEVCQYINKGDRLYINIPDNAGLKSVLKLISSNGEVEYQLSVIPNTEKHTVIWSGATEFMDWNGLDDLSWGKYDWSLVNPGTELNVTYTPVDPAVGWGCVSLRHGQDWGNLPEPIPGQYDFDVNGGTQVLTVELTAEILADLVANGGLVITGHNYILSQVELVEHISLEETIWTGESVVGNWDGSMAALAYGGYDWSTLKPGQKLFVYYKLNPEGGYHQIRLGNGSWVALPTTKTFENADGDGNLSVDADGVIEVTLTEDDLDQLVNNGGLVVCGAWFIVTKVTIL